VLPRAELLLMDAPPAFLLHSDPRLAPLHIRAILHDFFETLKQNFSTHELYI